MSTYQIQLNFKPGPHRDRVLGCRHRLTHKVINCGIEFSHDAEVNIGPFVVSAQLLVDPSDELSKALIPLQDTNKVDCIGQGGIDVGGQLETAVIIPQKFLHRVRNNESRAGKTARLRDTELPLDAPDLGRQRLPSKLV